MVLRPSSAASMTSSRVPGAGRVALWSSLVRFVLELLVRAVAVRSVIATSIASRLNDLRLLRKGLSRLLLTVGVLLLGVIRGALFGLFLGLFSGHGGLLVLESRLGRLFPGFLLDRALVGLGPEETARALGVVLVVVVALALLPRVLVGGHVLLFLFVDQRFDGAHAGVTARLYGLEL